MPLPTWSRTGLAVVALAVVSAGGARAQESYLCTEEQSTGFLFDKVRRAWQPSVLVADRKLVVHLDQGATRTWFVSEGGRRTSSYWCPSGWVNDEMSCTGIAGSFWMNRKTMRFLYVYKWGYLDGDSPDTPNITIGRCSPG
ncbi:hypothetical protein FHP25_33710 [Vineibacter terrae]|uniref:Uncharacterized protein n=1 Tax=Vineibacter terrae TaxID=2586908 RepID=A0A5C8PA27_9HYPH|nr:hypothetical protein [Vineibacter terrae]TXL70611.1 hypothetical protein FHP25_33710 [Vineibacter terrae]